MITERDIDTLIGSTAVDSDGDRIGSVSEVYLDDQSGRPEWATVKTGLFGTRETFIPLREAQLSDGSLRVPYDKAMVKDAPTIEAEGHLSPAEESELYRYYGVGDGTGMVGDHGRAETTTTETATRDTATRDTATRDTASAGTATTGVGALTDDGRTTGEHGDVTRGTSGLADLTGDQRTDRDDVVGRDDTVGAVGRDTSGPTTDDAMTRSEERLAVGTESTEVGRARLRKHVVTEDVTRTVPVSHEEVRIEREPITDANRGDALDGPALSEEEHEVTLHAERPVVEKETVPVERVRLGTETVTEEQQVNAQVAHEEIEQVEGGIRGDVPGDTRR